MRVLLLLSLQAAKVSDDEGPLGDLSGDKFANDERNAVSAALARTAVVVAPVGSVVIDQDIVSWDDQGPIVNPGQGAPIPGFPGGVAALPALAIVAIVSAAAAAACYVATVITQSQHAIAFEEEKTKRLIATQAAGIEVVAKHIEREKLFGQMLPFEEEERSIFRNLEKTQREIVAEKHVPLPTPFDGARDFGLALAETTRDVGKSTAETVSWALPAAIGVGVLWLMRK